MWTLFGKSCLEECIHENNVGGEFNCPVCHQSVRDYFPIFDVPIELFQIALNNTENRCQNEEDVIKHVHWDH
uniref:RING-type domain-containing protein n=1 Tax=Strongyloides venezuelensis TaxID=75913 RepID=A0A0K0EYR3_STRVS